MRRRIDYGAAVAHRGGGGGYRYGFECLDIREVNLQVLDVVATFRDYNFGLSVSGGGDAECRGILAGGIECKSSGGITRGLEGRDAFGTQLADGAHDGSRVTLGQDYAVNLTCLRHSRHKQRYDK